MCETYKIEFLSTPFDEESADILEKVSVRVSRLPRVILLIFP